MNKRSLLFIACVSVTLFLVNLWFSGDKKQAPAGAAPAAQIESVSLPKAVAAPVMPSSKEEQFYVLENPYQQLVFSNVGGALSEINLHLRDKQHLDSPVRPIRFDKIMARDFPGNDKYPEHPYQVNEGQGIQKKEG